MQFVVAIDTENDPVERSCSKSYWAATAAIRLVDALNSYRHRVFAFRVGRLDCDPGSQFLFCVLTKFPARRRASKAVLERAHPC